MRAESDMSTSDTVRIYEINTPQIKGRKCPMFQQPSTAGTRRKVGIWHVLLCPISKFTVLFPDISVVHPQLLKLASS